MSKVGLEALNLIHDDMRRESFEAHAFVTMVSLFPVTMFYDMGTPLRVKEF